MRAGSRDQRVGTGCCLAQRGNSCVLSPEGFCMTQSPPHRLDLGDAGRDGSAPSLLSSGLYPVLCSSGIPPPTKSNVDLQRDPRWAAPTTHTEPHPPTGAVLGSAGHRALLLLCWSKGCRGVMGAPISQPYGHRGCRRVGCSECSVALKPLLQQDPARGASAAPNA